MERKNTEIRDQAHLMDAEGTCDEEPRILEIKQFLLKYGYEAFNISVSYDNMQSFWRWNCDIKLSPSPSK